MKLHNLIFIPSKLESYNNCNLSYSSYDDWDESNGPGDGYGISSGIDYGYGGGVAPGEGHGDGYGSSFNNRYDTNNGYGDGKGAGYSCGSGDGYGDGDGYGWGNSSGDGYDPGSNFENKTFPITLKFISTHKEFIKGEVYSLKQVNSFNREATYLGRGTGRELVLGFNEVEELVRCKQFIKL